MKCKMTHFFALEGNQFLRWLISSGHWLWFYAFNLSDEKHKMLQISVTLYQHLPKNKKHNK